VRFACFIFAIILCSCKGKPDAGRKVNLLQRSSIERDSKEKDYYDSRLYLPNVVRLYAGSKRAFIYIDSPALNPGKLDSSNREAYYAKALATVSSEDLRVHEAIWAIPEVRKMQQGDGGYGTLVTWITGRPHPSDHYVVELRKNDIAEMTPLNDVSSFTVRLHPLKIEVTNSSGYYVPLAEWQAARK